MRDALQLFLCGKDAQSFIPLCIVHACIFGYAFCYWLCQPVEPYLLQKLGGDKMSYGYLQTTVGIFSLIGGPVIGWICDKKGANVASACTFAGGAVSYFVQAIAWNLPTLFLSKFLTFFMHSMHCAQVCVSHFSLHGRRPEALGRLAMSYGCGMVIGSTAGGFLGEHAGYQSNSWVACILSFALIPVMLLLVPTRNLVQPEQDGEGMRMLVIFEILSQPLVTSLVVSCTLVAVAGGLHRYTFPNVMLYHFKLRPSEQGIVLAVGGLVGAISQVLLVGPTLRCLGSHRAVVLAGIAALGACAIAYAFTGPSNLWLFYALIVPMSAASAIVLTIFMALFTQSVPSQRVGTAVAIAHAVSTSTGILMPIVGNFIYSEYGFMSLNFSAAVCFVLAFAHATFAIGLTPSSCSESMPTTPLQESKA